MIYVSKHIANLHSWLRSLQSFLKSIWPASQTRIIIIITIMVVIAMVVVAMIIAVIIMMITRHKIYSSSSSHVKTLAQT